MVGPSSVSLRRKRFRTESLSLGHSSYSRRKTFFEVEKQVIITWRKVRTVWRILENYLLQVFE